MAYKAPYVDETGLHLNSYEDIKQFYIDGSKGIFGDDIYVDDDSMDGQLISILAKATYDTQKSIQFAYNNTTPQTSYGVVLARLVLLSGISKKKAGYSTAFVKLEGTPFTIIHSGVVSDVAGNKWNLPTTVNLGENGVVSVTATAQDKGNITALANTITKIDTPTYGWKSVTNEYPASPASAVEQDSELRYRQRKSVALPSQGLVEGTQSAIFNIDGVTDCIVKDNDENTPKTIQGVELPPNSLTVIVKGGSEKDIANTIFYRKNQGVYTNGDIEIVQYDMFNNVNYIRFSRPKEVPIKISLKLKPLAGYSSDFSDQIKTNLVSYIDSLNISNDVSLSVLYSSINSVMSDLKQPIFSVTELQIGRKDGNLSNKDITINLNEEASLVLEDVEIEVEGA